MSPYLDAGGIKLHYAIDGLGDGPPSVLLNSIATDMDMWFAQLDAFTRKLSVIRFDARGHGLSGVPPPPSSLSDFGDDLVSLLDTQGLELVHLCGISLGGMVALWTAALHPERVGRVVVASAAPRIGTAEAWEERAAQARRGGMESLVDFQMDRFFRSQSAVSPTDELERIRRTILATPLEGYVGACLALRDADLSDLLPLITVPCLVLAGNFDRSTPPAEVERLHAGIRGSEFLVIEGGHLCNIDNPSAFNEAVLKFLAET